MKLGLNEFEAAVAVARLGSFRAAAEELGVSPTALSHSVAALERRLGVRLFNRTTRSVSTTDAGAEFISRIEPALAQMSAAVEEINNHRETPSGTLRINTFRWAARVVLAPIIGEYLRRFPAMTVVLVTEEAMVDIVAKGYDAGIRFSDTVPKDMIALPIVHSSRMTVVGSPDYFAQRTKPVRPEDLLSHRCIRGRFANGGDWRWEFQRDDQKIEIDVPGTLVLDDWSLMLEAALDSVGLAHTDYDAARSHIAAGRLVSVLEDWTLPFQGLSLYYPGRRHVPAGMRALISIIKEVNAKALA